MNTLRSIQIRLVIALVTAFAFVVGSSAKAADEPTGQVADAIELSVYCSMSGPTATGREWAKLVRSYVKDGLVYCTRVRVGGEAPIEIPSCHAQWNELKCAMIID